MHYPEEEAMKDEGDKVKTTRAVQMQDNIFLLLSNFVVISYISQ